MAKKLTKDVDGDGRPEQYGFYLDPQPWPLYWVIRSYGGELFDPATKKATLLDPRTVKALQFVADLIQKWVVQPVVAPGEFYQVFANRQVAMIHGLNDDAFGWDEAIGDKFAWGIAPSPKGPVKRAQFVGGSALAIPKGAKYSDIAYELIRYTLSNAEWQPLAGRIVSRYVARESFHP